MSLSLGCETQLSLFHVTSLPLCRLLILRISLEQTKQSYTLKTQQEINKVNRKFITYKQVRERVQALEELMESLVIYSDRSGIISYYSYPWGGVVKTGSRVNSYNEIIATFPNMKSLITKTFINEIDIN